MRLTSLVVLASSLFSLASARTQTGPPVAVPSPDGLIVPFSTLPACASLCGHLFDVQGACAPPHLAAVDKNCFCSDPRLTPILQGDAGVTTACGAQSCQDSADQQAIEKWYGGYCDKQVAQPSSTSSSASPTSTSGSGKGSKQPENKSWIAGHYGWVIFAVVVTLAIVVGWVTASYFRRRYLRKKEKEIEMQRPVSWGPHQMQAMTGGFANSETALGGTAGRATPVTETRAMGGDASAFVEPTKRESRGWLTKERR